MNIIPCLTKIETNANKNLLICILTNNFFFKYLTFPLIKFGINGKDFFGHFIKTNKKVVIRKVMPPDFLANYKWQWWICREICKRNYLQL